MTLILPQYRSPGEIMAPSFCLGFPGGSDGEESACSVGDLGAIPGLGRSPGGGNGCPLQYSWASLVTQPVKNPSAMQQIWVQSLGWEDPLKKGMGYPLQWVFSILA